MADINSNPVDIRPLLGSNLSRIQMGADAFIGDIIYPNAQDEAVLVDANNASSLVASIALIVGAEHLNRADGSVKMGEWVTVCWEGRVALNTGNLDVTKKLFASDTAGKLADSAGTNARILGAPISKNIILFDGMAK